MKLKNIALAIVSASALLAGSAFASSYGPAPFYHPTVGAPASERGQSEQTVSAERQAAGNDGAISSYGGVAPASSASDSGRRVAAPDNLYKGR
ncbi:hypothetical protein P0D69_22180 [Paraburkholderia sediminicola]|uniref:hypothetical protein n=1 Tax=Paraburkholderia sediminicola TaxID=458836 RepID=UPI0038B8E702